MKCLSIQQPWAWAILFAGKPVENRTWHMYYRGPLALHASRTFDRAGYDYCVEHFPDIHWPHPMHYERGGLVGVCEVTGCVREHPSRWFFGPWGILVRDPIPCEFTLMRGQRGLFEINPAKIKLRPAVSGQVTSER
jgi:hypothetical protein